MCRISRQIVRLCVVAVLFAALASTGFAHRLTAAERDPSMIAYLQVGGTLDALCGGLDRSAQGALKSCEACRLVGAAILPGPAQVGMPISLQLPRTLHPVNRSLPGNHRIALSHPVRAPPFI